MGVRALLIFHTFTPIFISKGTGEGKMASLNTHTLTRVCVCVCVHAAPTKGHVTCTPVRSVLS